MFNEKFSLMRAYFTGMKILLEYLSFYMIWQAIVLVAWLGMVIGIGLYLDVLDYQALTTNWSWIGTIIVQLFSEIKVKWVSIFADFSLHGLLQLALPKQFLNHMIETMSWTEYFHIIVLPKKIPLILLLSVVVYFSMTVSIGFIKTALSLQGHKVVSFLNMIQYCYMVPSYCLVKMIVGFSCGLPIALLVVLCGYVDGVIRYGAIGFVVAMVIFLYQRLRFAKYFVVDENMDCVQACLSSWKLTRGSVIHLFIFSIVAVVIISCHLSGLLMYLFLILDKQAEVSVYRQLTGQQQ